MEFREGIIECFVKPAILIWKTVDKSLELRNIQLCWIMVLCQELQSTCRIFSVSVKGYERLFRPSLCPSRGFVCSFFVFFFHISPNISFRVLLRYLCFCWCCGRFFKLAIAGIRRLLILYIYFIAGSYAKSFAVYSLGFPSYIINCI